MPLAAVVFVDRDPITSKSVMRVHDEDQKEDEYLCMFHVVSQRDEVGFLKILESSRPFE